MVTNANKIRRTGNNKVWKETSNTHEVKKNATNKIHFLTKLEHKKPIQIQICGNQ